VFFRSVYFFYLFLLDPFLISVMLYPAEMIGECGQNRPGKFINQVSHFFSTSSHFFRHFLDFAGGGR